MKSLDRFQFLANVLTVVCKRPNAEVGKLVKALVTYATDGTRTSRKVVSAAKVRNAELQEIIVPLTVLQRERM